MSGRERTQHDAGLPAMGKITQRPPRPTTARAPLFRSRFAVDRFDPWPRATRYENARIFETFSEMRMAGVDVKRTLRIAVVDVALVPASAEGAHALA
jgi:hypothetical protein